MQRIYDHIAFPTVAFIPRMINIMITKYGGANRYFFHGRYAKFPGLGFGNPKMSREELVRKRMGHPLVKN